MSILDLKYGPEFNSLRKAKGTHEIPDHIAEFFSDISLEVLQEFGWETPKLLNEYSCALEDACIALQKENNELRRLKGEAVLAELRTEAKQEKKKAKKKSKRFNKKNKM
jgi:hypothetical protein